MDGKIIVYGFCLALVVAGSLFWQYTMDIDEAQKEMLLARQQVNAAEEGVKQARAWLNARKEAAALIAAAAVIEKKNADLNDEIKKLRDRRKEIARIFQTTLERVREETQGMQLPELVLKTGATYRNVKIQSVTEALTVLQHSGGVSKIPTPELPDHLQDRLRYGFIPGAAGKVQPSNKGAMRPPPQQPASDSLHSRLLNPSAKLSA
jgi:hypothetical protein